MATLSQSDLRAIKAMVPGALKRQERERRLIREFDARPVTIRTQPEWTEVAGMDALRVPGSKYAAIPATGRRNARNFIVFDTTSREEVCFLTKAEVRGWLVKNA